MGNNLSRMVTPWGLQNQTGLVGKPWKPVLIRLLPVVIAILNLSKSSIHTCFRSPPFSRRPSSPCWMTTTQKSWHPRLFCFSRGWSRASSPSPCLMVLYNLIKKIRADRPWSLRATVSLDCLMLTTYIRCVQSFRKWNHLTQPSAASWSGRTVGSRRQGLANPETDH